MLYEEADGYYKAALESLFFCSDEVVPLQFPGALDELIVRRTTTELRIMAPEDDQAAAEDEEADDHAEAEDAGENRPRQEGCVLDVGHQPDTEEYKGSQEKEETEDYETETADHVEADGFQIAVMDVLEILIRQRILIDDDAKIS